MMDSNGNGKIDQEEIDRMPSFVRDMMKARGVELKPGMSLDDMRNGFRSSASGGTPPNGQPNNGQQPNNATAQKTLTPFKMKPKKALTLALPPAYSEVDTDFDGQIGMYEWMMTRRNDLDRFDEMDFDGDGYLIPEELLAVESATATQTVADASIRQRLVIVSATPTRVRTNAAPGQPGQPSPNGQSSNSRNPWSSGDPATIAPEIFKRLDGNGDGSIDPEEWQQSRRTREMFEQAGIKLEKMSVEQFSQHYLRLSANNGGGR